MKKFFSNLLSDLFFFALIGTLLLGIARKNLSGSTLTNIALEMMKPVTMKIPDDGLFYPDGGKIIQTVQFDTESFDFSNIDFSNLDLNELVAEYCEAAGIDVDPEIISEVIADPQTSKFVDKYVTEIAEYVTGAKTELNINPEDVQKVVNNAIDKYEVKTGEKIDRTGINENIAAVIENSSDDIIAAIDEVKEENSEALDKAKIVIWLLSLKVFLLCIAVCIILALVILLINKNIFVWFKYISVPSIVAGSLLFFSALIFNGMFVSIEQMIFNNLAFELPLTFVTTVESIVLTILKQVKITGAVTILISVILCVFGCKLAKKTEQ